MTGFEDYASHAQRTIYAEDERLSSYVDNWDRLRLMKISYTEHLTNDALYSWVETRPELHRLRQEYEGQERVSIEWDKGILQVTDFGRRFAKAVAIL
jgi:hypothetical protein